MAMASNLLAVASNLLATSLFFSLGFASFGHFQDLLESQAARTQKLSKNTGLWWSLGGCRGPAWTGHTPRPGARSRLGFGFEAHVTDGFTKERNTPTHLAGVHVWETWHSKDD